MKFIGQMVWEPCIETLKKQFKKFSESDHNTFTHRAKKIHPGMQNNCVMYIIVLLRTFHIALLAESQLSCRAAVLMHVHLCLHVLLRFSQTVEDMSAKVPRFHSL